MVSKKSSTALNITSSRHQTFDTLASQAMSGSSGLSPKSVYFSSLASTYWECALIVGHVASSRPSRYCGDPVLEVSGKRQDGQIARKLQQLNTQSCFTRLWLGSPCGASITRSHVVRPLRFPPDSFSHSISVLSHCGAQWPVRWVYVCCVTRFSSISSKMSLLPQVVTATCDDGPSSPCGTSRRDQ